MKSTLLAISLLSTIVLAGCAGSTSNKTGESAAQSNRTKSNEAAPSESASASAEAASIEAASAKAASEAASAKTASAEAAQRANIYEIGQTIETDKGLKLTVNSVRETDQVDDFLNTAEDLGGEDRTYIIIDATLENTTDQEINSFSSLDFTLKDEEGRIAETVYSPNTNGQLDGDIVSGDKLTGELIYEVPKNGELILSYKPSYRAGTVRIKIR